MRKLLVVTLLLCVAVEVVNATAQEADKLTFRGEKYYLFVNPLEQYFKSHNEKRPKVEVRSTALWRGYVASFEIKDSMLYVSDIEIAESVNDTAGRRMFQWKSMLESVFVDSTSRFCSWYTGLLVIPIGELTSYIHMGYASLYEKYMILRIKNGLLTKIREFTGKEYYQFKRQQFQAYKDTDEFKNSLKELTKDGRNSSEMEEFLFEYEIEYTSRFLFDEL